MGEQEQIEIMRHSLAHIMASAVQNLWPEARFGVGPAVQDGFYYDVDVPEHKVGKEDLGAIEAEMSRIIAADEQFEQFVLPIEEAIEWAKKYNQPYKLELLNDLKRAGTTAIRDLDVSELGLDTNKASEVSEVSFYRNGDFTDLCRGPHIDSTGKVGAFKLLRVSGAYWRGQENKPQLQRIYGLAFSTKDELKRRLTSLKEAKVRDHRKLGQELDLFVMSDLVGAGLPLFTPRGAVLREELGCYAQELKACRGFARIWTPSIAKTDLYKTSGHWDKFGDELFLVKSQETSDEFVLRPMNCPHHIQIYAARPRSYRELPLKFMENATDYRDEKTGELHGISRVRAFTQDDSHAFVRENQIKQVSTELVEAAREMYGRLGMALKFRLSFRGDGQGYLGDPNLWERAQKTIEEIASENKLDYVIALGEAAFYGPKMDFIVEDALGREWQVATVQLDFVLPERFKLEYTDSEGKLARPVMIHCALLGSIERFLAVYIEHTAGKFPVWLAPEQIRIVTVNQESKITQFASKLIHVAKEQGLRVAVDNDNESVGKKIRAAELFKVPYVVVIGERELASGQITPRIRQDLVQNSQQDYTLGAEEFFKAVAKEVKERASRTSL